MQRDAMNAVVKELQSLHQERLPIPSPWNGRAVVNEDNLTYVVWNESSREALVVDPMREDWECLLSLARDTLRGYRFVAVIDTHTHADHVSCAGRLANELGVPLIQHVSSPSRAIHLRLSKDTALPTAAGPLHLLVTPGHTGDSITPIWGPFLFGGDTLLFGDTGRDDLPGGDPGDHWDSLQKIKSQARPDLLMLPGHDLKGGRISTWKHQLEISPALSQDRETFIQDGGAWVGPSPKHLKESLYENFK